MAVLVSDQCTKRECTGLQIHDIHIFCNVCLLPGQSGGMFNRISGLLAILSGLFL